MSPRRSRAKKMVPLFSARYSFSCGAGTSKFLIEILYYKENEGPFFLKFLVGPKVNRSRSEGEELPD